MRADRLLSLMMLLQTRGCLTAARLAEELEVSERTIYRDVEALSAAGVPVYAERGPGGGVSLLESYRTNLTGFSGEELRALFMLNIPAPLVQLGLSQELKAALLKLSAALPSNRLEMEQRTRQRFYLDPAGRPQEEEALLQPLQVMQKALWSDRKLRLRYRGFFWVDLEQEVSPLGLVARADEWNLVFWHEDHYRVIRAAWVYEVEILEQPAQRPVGFDLPVFWQEWCAVEDANRPIYPVTLRITQAMARTMSGSVRKLLQRVGPPDEQGWLHLRLEFASLDEARQRLLPLGGAVEVLEPKALRVSMQDFAEQIGKAYQK